MIRASHENPETTAPRPCNMTSAPETDAAPPEKIDRDELLSISSALIKSLDRRLRSRVFRSSKHDGVKLAYARALTAVIAAHGTLLKDRDLDTLEQRIAALEQKK